MSKGMNDKTSLETIKTVQQIGRGIDWNIPQNNQLIAALLALKNATEVKLFLRDLMTEAEVKEFANRLEAASLLSRKVQYSPIIERTGLSSTTIARIAKWLKGPLGGYRLILSRINSTSTKFDRSHHSSSQLRKGLSV